MNKPKFNPAQPFSPVDVRPKFDPSAGFEPVNQPSAPAEAALQGFGQAASLGYLPQLQAMTQPFTDRALNLVTGQDVEPAPLKQAIPLTKEYVQARDAAVLRDKQLKEQNPVSYGAGGLGGAVASAAIPMGALAKGGGYLKAAMSGGLLGAAQNPGDTQGSIDPLQLKQRAAGSVTGAGLGVAGQAVGKAISGLKDIPQKLSDTSDALAFRSLGAFKRDVTKALGKDKTGEAGKTLKELGRFAKEKGLVKGGDDIFDVAEKAGALQKETGEKIGEIYKSVNEKISDPKFRASLPNALDRLDILKTELIPKKLSREFMEEVASKWTGRRGGDQAIARVEQEVNNFAKNSGVADIEKVKQFRVDLDKAIKFEKDDAIQGALKDFRNFLKTKMDARINLLDKLDGSEKSKALKEANAVYSKTIRAKEIIDKRLAAEYGNNIFSITDKMFMGAGAVGGMINNPNSFAKQGLTAGTLGLLSKAGRRYGAPLLMQGTDTAAKALAPVGGFLQRAANVAPGFLSDPRYRGALGQRLGRDL